MARGKTIYISGTGKPKPGQGIKVWGPRRKYSPVRRNYSTTDRANFTARIVKNITMEPYTSSVGVDDAYVYMFINVYKELYESEYKSLIQKMYEEFMIKKYTCTMSLDGSSSLVTVNMPQSTFYCAQDRNGINAEGGFKKPQDYASVYSKPINYYSPFKTGCSLSVSGIQEASSFISCDMFKPLTGLWGEINSKTDIPDPTSYRYSQNQTYSQYMFKPVILCAVKVPTQPIGTENKVVQPTFTVELKIDLVGRGIRALKNDVSNLTVSNAAKSEDIAAGKIAFDYSGNSMTGTMISPINTVLTLTENGVYNVGDESGGYPISAVSQLNINVPKFSKLHINTVTYTTSAATYYFNLGDSRLLRMPASNDGNYVISSDIVSDYVNSNNDVWIISYSNKYNFQSNVTSDFYAIGLCQSNAAGNSRQIYTPWNNANCNYVYLIPLSVLGGLTSIDAENGFITIGNTPIGGTFTFYAGAMPGFKEFNHSGFLSYFAGVATNTIYISKE